jgi:hypothetical protein
MIKSFNGANYFKQERTTDEIVSAVNASFSKYKDRIDQAIKNGTIKKTNESFTPYLNYMIYYDAQT